jgi:IclR family pca regulon transcriptional regulator
MPSTARREVARVRSQGHASVDQELGLRTLSVPLKNGRGEVLAALNVSVNAAQVGMARWWSAALPRCCA